MADFTPIICIDFDGVIHSYDRGWRKGIIYGRVVNGFWAWAESAQAGGLDLRIYSSRSSDAASRELMIAWLEQQWSQAEADGGPEQMSVRNEDERLSFWRDGKHVFTLRVVKDKPPAFVTIDDRAIQFRGDWSAPELTAEAMRAFKPWNVGVKS